MCKSLVTLKYERINPAYRVWHDADSGANRDCSFWAIRNSNGFYRFDDDVTALLSVNHMAHAIYLYE